MGTLDAIWVAFKGAPLVLSELIPADIELGPSAFFLAWKVSVKVSVTVGAIEMFCPIKALPLSMLISANQSPSYDSA
jgi:hypothetical protein